LLNAGSRRQVVVVKKREEKEQLMDVKKKSVFYLPFLVASRNESL
jgi:hypothetical protein